MRMSTRVVDTSTAVYDADLFLDTYLLSHLDLEAASSAAVAH